MPPLAARSVEVGNAAIQFGVEPKTGVEGRIDFAEPFGEIPTVVISPFWEGRRSEVGHAETLDRVELDHCVVMSDNAAPDYFVSWIALGARAGETLPPVAPTIEAGDMVLTFGLLPKDLPGSSGSGFGFDFAEPPNVQVSPAWQRQRRGVGHAETISDVSEDGFNTVSGNADDDYAISWVATGTRSGAPPTNEFAVGEMLIRIGTANKRDGLWRVGLGGEMAFAEPPVLVVSPAWESGAVGHAETLNHVEPHYFEVVSGNAAENYRVFFIAIGPRA